jgi:(2Fe-2S) ferredoxin
MREGEEVGEDMGGAFHRLARGCKAHLTPAGEGAHAAGRMPHRDRYLFVCTNRRAEDNPKGSCAQKGSEEILRALKSALLERGLAKATRACSSSCLDLCESGVTIVVEPEHVVYGKVTLADVDAIADGIAKGQIVERLVVPRPARST